MTRAGEAAEGQKASSIVILILGLEGGFGTLCNSTELRAVGLTLEPVGPVGGAPLGVVARVRRAAAAAGDAARRRLPGVAQAVHQQLAPAPRELSVISPADENVILANCW